MKGLARLVLTLALAASLAATLWSGAQIARDPTLRPIIDRTTAEIVAATDRMMAREATPERLTALINTRLNEVPRNWVALQALADLAAERDIPLPHTYATAQDADHSLTATARDCAACAYDPASCTLSNVLICQAPVALTPAGDFIGIGRAGAAYMTGAEVDEIDFALSLIGLGATAAIIASGGSSVALKAGASTVKLARRMGLVSPRLTAMALDASRSGVDWAALPAARSADDLARLIRADAMAPLTATITDLNRLRTSTSATHALHLLPLIDDAADARRLARAGDALGPRLVARAEVLGKVRLLRATTRLSDVALTLFGGFASLAGQPDHAGRRRDPNHPAAQLAPPSIAPDSVPRQDLILPLQPLERLSPCHTAESFRPYTCLIGMGGTVPLLPRRPGRTPARRGPAPCPLCPSRHRGPFCGPFVVGLLSGLFVGLFANAPSPPF